MLKIVKLSLMVMATSAIFAGQVHAKAGNSLKNLCTTISTDTHGELSRKLQAVHSGFQLTHSNQSPKLACGGDSLIRTAMLHTPVESGKSIIKRMPKRTVLLSKEGKKSILTWASDNNIGHTPVAKAPVLSI